MFWNGKTAMDGLSGRGSGRIDDRRKLKQHAIPRGLDDPAPVLRHEGICYLAVFAVCAGSADLVEPHEPRVTGYVSRDYRCQPASDTTWLLLLHGQAAPATSPYRDVA
jgi:hypothetical protein